MQGSYMYSYMYMYQLVRNTCTCTKGTSTSGLRGIDSTHTFRSLGECQQRVANAIRKQYQPVHVHVYVRVHLPVRISLQELVPYVGPIFFPSLSLPQNEALAHIACSVIDASVDISYAGAVVYAFAMQNVTANFTILAIELKSNGQQQSAINYFGVLCFGHVCIVHLHPAN